MSIPRKLVEIGIAEDYIIKITKSYNEIEKCEEQVNWVEHIATGKKYDLKTWRHYDRGNSEE